MIRSALVAALLLSASPALATERCVDISKKDSLRFSGTLRHKIFAGPPGYADVRKGDTPEPTYILELDRDACAAGDEMISDGATFRTIHLFSSKDDKVVWSALRRLVGRKVYVQGGSAFGEHTGHHHAPVVMDVVSVSADRDVTESYGTAQTTVEAFYAALRAANGEEAANLVVPEKRTNGPFSAAEISRFYGSLSEPLSVLDMMPDGPNRYRVRNSYTKAGQPRCEGQAAVTTKRVGDLNLIFGIKALHGC